jgi:hypothetical protein
MILSKTATAKKLTSWPSLDNEQGGIRTPDLLIRSQKLYPLSYLPKREYHYSTYILTNAKQFS